MENVLHLLCCQLLPAMRHPLYWQILNDKDTHASNIIQDISILHKMFSCTWFTTNMTNDMHSLISDIIIHNSESHQILLIDNNPRKKKKNVHLHPHSFALATRRLPRLLRHSAMLGCSLPSKSFLNCKAS